MGMGTTTWEWEGLGFGNTESHSRTPLLQTAFSNQKSTFLNSSISYNCLLCLRQDSNCHVLTTASQYLYAYVAPNLALTSHTFPPTEHVSGQHHTLADVDHRESTSAADPRTHCRVGWVHFKLQATSIHRAAEKEDIILLSISLLRIDGVWKLF